MAQVFPCDVDFVPSTTLYRTIATSTSSSGQLSHILVLYTTPHTPWDVLCVVPLRVYRILSEFFFGAPAMLRLLMLCVLESINSCNVFRHLSKAPRSGTAVRWTPSLVGPLFCQGGGLGLDF